MKQKISPWLWVPTLYFAEGIPYFIVNNISTAMFTKLGVANGEMALFTSLLYLPWTLKPFWSPFVDVLRTKRWWVVSMQMLIAAVLIGLSLSLPHPSAEQIAQGTTPISLFTVTLVLFVITAFASATHDIAADGFYMLALDGHSQAAYVGLRNVFYRLSNVFCNSALVFIAGYIESSGKSISTAWQVTIMVAAVVFSLIAVWHLFFMPKVEHPTTDRKSLSEVMRDVVDTLVSFFRKPHILIAIVFILLYRVPEAFMLKMVAPFMLGQVEQGGLGLTLEQYGLVYGIVGVVAMLLGGVLGGVYASQRGLKRSLWLMVAFITLPDAVYLWLSMAQPTNLWLINCAIGLEQFGYGFGFTAYMLYLMYFSEGQYKTSHYAICTAFMALSMMLPGAVAGYVQVRVGYQNFFWIVMVCCLMTFAAAAVVYKYIDPKYGKK